MKESRYNELHIFEESNHLFWGLLIFVCTSIGTYLLAGSFIFIEWNVFNFDQLVALLLFAISFRGIFVLSEPLYHLVLYFEDRILVIEIKKGDLHVETLQIPGGNIDALKFAPHAPRKSHEALFDFSPSYHLLYKKRNQTSYHKLLDVNSGAITLKVDDIGKIMRFIKEKNSSLYIPGEQAQYFGI